jgi:D-beta-D-heptose 7-phosphate kinase/D-beta-D-heptose 1-phosphate adenosyltransferase
MEILSLFSGKKILVLGDCMLDHWIWGKVRRISPEAPVPVVEVEKHTYTLGGAANVVNNLRSLGASVSFAGVIGTDREGRILKAEMQDRNVATDGLFADPARPTTLKTRIIAHHQQVVRADFERRGSLSSSLNGKLAAYVRKNLKNFDGLLISDYNKGVINRELMEKIIPDISRSSVIGTANPKPENIPMIKGLDLVALNESEAGSATGLSINGDESVLSLAGRKLIADLGCGAVLITRGENGISLFEGRKSVRLIPALATEVYDVSGAGDTVISTVTLALAAGADCLEATRLANHAAAVVVRKVGTATVTSGEIMNSIRERK